MTRALSPLRLGALPLILVAGLTAGLRDVAAQNANPTVLPPGSSAFGASYGEWSARWWQWALGVPAAQNPVADSTGANCAAGQSGPVWFLAGTFGGGAVTRACTVPAGKVLFFPILTAAFGAGVGDCAPTGVGPCDVTALRAGAAAAMNNPMTLMASIDGVAVQNLSAYRVQSPVFSLTLPVDAIFGLPAGTFSPNVADGYYVMLAPLSAGPHTIALNGVNNGGFTVEVTYNLTVR